MNTNSFRKILDKIEYGYDMDDINQVKKFVNRYVKYLKVMEGKSSYDIEVLPSKKFTQIFIAHNVDNDFKIYNTWDFKRDVLNTLVKKYYNNKICDNPIFIKELDKIFKE